MAEAVQKIYSGGFRSWTAWAFALLAALVLNVFFFGLMPGLVTRAPDKIPSAVVSKPVRVTRIDPPKTIPEKSPPAPIEKMMERSELTQAKPIMQQPIDHKVEALPLELNPALPPSAVVLRAPRLESMALPSIEFSGVFDEINVDVKPSPTAAMEPVYPLRAERMGIQGYVNVEFTVTKDGRAKDIRIIEAKPKNVFEQSVINCVSSWRFSPGKKDGQSVETRKVRRLIRFQLEN